MKTSRKNYEKNVGGISIHAILWPIIAIVIILHISIISLIININSQTAVLSQTMSNSGNYVSEASDIIATSSQMSETVTNYVLMPLTEEGEVNFGPITAFMESYTSENHPKYLSEKFKGYDVSDTVKEKIAAAGEMVAEMNTAQLHAVALVDSVYPLPAIPPLAALELPELTNREKALTDEEKINAARLLVLGTDYAENKRGVSVNIKEVIAEIRQTSGQQAGMLSAKVGVMRQALWIITLVTIVILTMTFFGLFRTLVIPIRRFVRLISADANMEENRGIKEIRLVAAAYNSLLRRRDSLDNLLRLAAETDTLTNLPNRYGFEQYLLDVEEHGNAMAILLFDVNYLKETNDNYGHEAGDVLLKQTADCISKCFGEKEYHNCFRFGGDEFAAVLRNPSESAVEEMIREFEEMQKNKHISVSWGYAIHEESDKKTVKELLREADMRMYAQKRRMHEMSV